MLTISKVFDAINRLLVKRWPKHTVHVNQEPQGFQRPCFALFEDYINMDDGGLDCVEFTLSYTIVGYRPKDKHGNTDNLGLIQLKGEILDLFRSGRIEVEERSLPITGINSSMENGAVYVDIELRFYDDRENPTERPKMEHIQTKTIIE